MAKQKKKKVISKLKHRYRLVVMSDQSFEERWSYRLTALNVIAAIVGFIVVFVFIGTLLMSLTPLKQLIPEYPNASFYKQMVQNGLRLDSLENELLLRDQYVRNLRHILVGDSRTEIEDIHDTVRLYENIDLDPSPNDSTLRKRVELDMQARLSNSEKNTSSEKISQMNFFTPVKGLISNRFNYSDGHYGTDIVAENSTPIHAALKGTVINSYWSLETGYSLQIQHSGEVITVYKHNELLTKQQGDIVQVGEVIGFVGNTGVYSSGPHLHFELWHKGSPVDAEIYINFE